MTHSEFVEAYRSKGVEVRVDKQMALRVMESQDMPGRFRAAHLFWSWIWLLSFPLAIVLGIFVQWWVGLIVLVVALLLPRSIKHSAIDFVLEQCVENEAFYDKAVSSGLLRLSIKRSQASRERQNG